MSSVHIESSDAAECTLDELEEVAKVSARDRAAPTRMSGVQSTMGVPVFILLFHFSFHDLL